MKSATTKTDPLNEYESSVDRVFVNLAKGESEAVSPEEMNEIMDEIFDDATNVDFTHDEFIEPTNNINTDLDLVDNDVSYLETAAIVDAPLITTEGDVREGNENENVNDIATAEEVLAELSNLTKYKLNTAGIRDLRSKGMEMLGDNLQTERQKKIAQEAREAAQINAAVEHYHNGQSFRRSKRQNLMDKSNVPRSKMNWENKWDDQCDEWGETRN
jgi:hypothetical protein